MERITPDVVEAARSTGPTPIGNPVLLGIGDAPLAESRDAVDFAVAEANRRHADLWLVHGCDPLSTLTAPAPTASADERRIIGERASAVVAEYVTGRLDAGRQLRYQVADTTGSEAIVDLSPVASLIVLQRRAVPASRRWHTGSTTSRVCAQAHAPVAVVLSGLARTSADDVTGETPGAGSPVAESPAAQAPVGAIPADGVVVGVDSHGHGAVALSTAFDEARLRGSEVIAVHAWEAAGPPTITGYVPPDHYELELLSHNAEKLLTEVLTDPRAANHDVPVRPLAVRGPAAEVLVEVSRSAALLVVGRHRGHAVASVGLGSVARHVLGHATCPVIVTPPSRTTRRTTKH